MIAALSCSQKTMTGPAQYPGISVGVPNLTRGLMRLYKTFLLQVEAAIPKWETELKNIDLEKVPQISYSRGKSIVDQRDLGLVEVSNIRTYIALQQHKRSVSGELALFGFLQSLYDIGQEIVWEEDFSGLTLTHFEKYAPELSSLEIRINNDAMARVALLEKSTCTK
jgi:hypothetical protein